MDAEEKKVEEEEVVEEEKQQQYLEPIALDAVVPINVDGVLNI